MASRKKLAIGLAIAGTVVVAGAVVAARAKPPAPPSAPPAKYVPPVPPTVFSPPPKYVPPPSPGGGTLSLSTLPAPITGQILAGLGINSTDPSLLIGKSWNFDPGFAQVASAFAGYQILPGMYTFVGPVATPPAPPTAPPLTLKLSNFTSKVWGQTLVNGVLTTLYSAWITITVQGGTKPFLVGVSTNNGFSADNQVNNKQNFQPPGSSPANPAAQGTYDFGITYNPEAFGYLTSWKVEVQDANGNLQTATIAAPADAAMNGYVF